MSAILSLPKCVQLTYHIYELHQVVTIHSVCVYPIDWSLY